MNTFARRLDISPRGLAHSRFRDFFGLIFEYLCEIQPTLDEKD